MGFYRCSIRIICIYCLVALFCFPVYAASIDKEQQIVSSDLENSEVFFIKHVKPETVKSSLDNISGLNISICSYPPSIIVSGTLDKINLAKKIIKVLDCEVPRVKVSFEIVEVNHEQSKKLGVDWNEISSTASFSKNILETATEFSDSLMKESKKLIDTQTGFVIHHNELENNGKILARPYIVTLNGSEAYLSTGDEVPIFTRDSYGNPYVDFKRVGIELYVTPFIMDNENKILNLQSRAIVNIISKESSQNGLTAPQISAREAKTDINIKSGQTLVIGGLYKEENVWSESKVPLLSKVPVLGSLFKNSNSKHTITDVLILITPEIISTAEATDG